MLHSSSNNRGSAPAGCPGCAVVYSLDLTREHGRYRERNVRESYLLARTGGRWLITHNEIYRGD